MNPTAVPTRTDGITEWVSAGGSCRHDESMPQHGPNAWFSNRKKAPRNAAQSDVTWRYIMS